MISRLASAALLALWPLAAAAIPIFDYATEFVHETTGHYRLVNGFATVAPSPGEGGRATGYVRELGFGDGDGRSEVCAFHAPTTESYFYTANPSECSYLRDNPTGWQFQGTPFRADPAQAGSCPDGILKSAVFRLYNNRAMFGDPNHRF